MTKNMELIDTEDIFENEEYVLIKAKFKWELVFFVTTSIGIKNADGDIIRIIEVDNKIIEK